MGLSTIEGRRSTENGNWSEMKEETEPETACRKVGEGMKCERSRTQVEVKRGRREDWAD